MITIEAVVRHVAKEPHPIQMVQLIQTREISVLNPTVIIFGKIQSGTTSNIIPNDLEMEGTIRYLYDLKKTSGTNPRMAFERIVENVCKAHRLKYEIEDINIHPGVSNDPVMAEIAQSAAERVVNKKDKIVPHVTMMGEDFCFFSNKVPSAFYFIGAGNEVKRTTYPHHNPHFNIDEDALPIGVEMHVRTALNYLNAL